MTHSIDFKGIEERLFLLQQMVLGSRYYCEERGICRRSFPSGDGGWLDYSGSLQQLVSTYTIECAVKTRVVQDFIVASPNPVEMKRLESEATEGFSFGIVHEGNSEKIHYVIRQVQHSCHRANGERFKSQSNSAVCPVRFTQGCSPDA